MSDSWQRAIQQEKGQWPLRPSPIWSCDMKWNGKSAWNDAAACRLLRLFPPKTATETTMMGVDVASVQDTDFRSCWRSQRRYIPANRQTAQTVARHLPQIGAEQNVGVER